MDFIEYKTLTVGYEGFIFDYTVDTGCDVQVYHDSCGKKEFIESVEISRELDGISGLMGFATGWYAGRVIEESVKHIYTEDGKLTITVGKSLKFQQECFEIDKYDTHHEILIYRIEDNGEETCLDSIQIIDKLDYDAMLLMVDDWLEGNQKLIIGDIIRLTRDPDKQGD